MKQVFKLKDISRIYRLANAVKQAQPGIGNPSSTAYKASNIMRQTMDQSVISLGFASSGSTGALAVKVALGSSEELAWWWQALKTNKAIRGIITPPEAPAFGQYGVVGSVSGSREAREEVLK